MEITEFIDARLSEDEGWASTATPGPWRATGTDIVSEAADPHWRGACAANASSVDGEHIARHDPARVLREVAAKRARLAYYEHAQAMLDHIIAHPGSESPGDQGMWLGKTAAARMACRYDAAIWSDHGDYRPEWAPEPSPSSSS